MSPLCSASPVVAGTRVRVCALAIVIGLVALASGAGAQERGGAARPAGGGATPEVRSRLVQGNVWLISAGFVNVAAQIGPDGVFVVDTGTEAMGEKILAEITRLAGDKPIRYIVNTHAHADHIGGNVVIAKAGRSIIAGNFAGQAGAEAANAAKIVAHENTQLRMAGGEGNQPAAPTAAMPTDTFFVKRHDMFFNGEAVQMLHQPNAHTDGDLIVYFRKSDVIVSGDVYINTTFPVINVQQGGSVNGIIAALNRIIELTVPKDKQEGGTFVIPGHGRIADEADVVEYLDMMTIVRDRLTDAIAKKMTLEQVKTAKLVRDYEGRYGATQGLWTTDAFLDAAYKSLTASADATSRAR
jgi:glyoxylase-like metal-dependent hydrolase (beta-lactamase superfamily II)